MSHPSDGVEDAPLHDLDPEAILHRDSRVLLDPRFLVAMHRELLDLGDAQLARQRLLRVGFLHGMQDAMQVAGSTFGHDAYSPPLTIRCRSIPANGAVEVRGDWPERREARARLSPGGADSAGCCAFSAGYTSGWFSTMLDADMLAVEQHCSSEGHERCCFVAREASLWRPDELCGMPVDAIPFDTFRSLVRTRDARRAPELHLPMPETLGIDRDDACVHIWGPVMVIPFGGPEEGLRALELIGCDPEAAEVSVVIIHLGHTLIDEAFGALALEQIVQTAESWGAETLIAEPSPLCERVLAELEHPPLMVLKDLEEAVVIGFQIAASQRRLC